MQKLKMDSALLSFLYKLVYSLSRFRAKQATAVQVPVFQVFRDRWTLVQAEEISIEEETSYAQALVDEADDAIDDFCGRFSKALLVITKDNTAHALYVFYFGGKTLSDFRAPKLNIQLKAMKSWVDPLQKSPFPTLLAMAPELVTLLDQADKAVAAKEKAQVHRREFRTVGARRQFVDELNAARTLAYGELDKLPFLTPGLPADYADRFFPQEPPAEEPVPDTIESVTTRIADLQKALADAQALLQKLQAEAAKAALDEEQRQRDEAALAGLDQQEEELRKQREALLAKLGKK
jgi:hypothetical protein